jgi:hypothetical protein
MWWIKKESQTVSHECFVCIARRRGRRCVLLHDLASCGWQRGRRACRVARRTGLNGLEHVTFWENSRKNVGRVYIIPLSRTPDDSLELVCARRSPGSTLSPCRRVPRRLATASLSSSNSLPQNYMISRLQRRPLLPSPAPRLLLSPPPPVPLLLDTLRFLSILLPPRPQPTPTSSTPRRKPVC